MPDLPRPRPIFVALGVVVAGILLANLLPAGPFLTPICYGLAVVSFLVALLLLNRFPWGVALFVMPLLFVAAGRAGDALQPGPNDIARWQGRPSVWVRGTVISDAEEKAHGSVGVTLAAREVDDYERRQTVTGQIRVTLRGLPRTVRPALGEEVWVRGRVEEPPPATNPGGFDYQAYLRRRGIFSALVTKQPRDVRRGETVGVGPVQAVVSNIRGTVLNATGKYLASEDAALMNGLLLSVRSNLPVELEDAFARTGSVHILSVSGLHLTTLAVFLAWILGLFAAPRPVAALTSIALLWLFALASGGGAAAVRSAVMATFFLAAPLVRRRGEPLHALTAAGVGILLVQPGALYDPGFQLSFVTTATLLLWGPPLLRLWLPWEPGLPWWMKPVYGVLGGILIGLIAEFGSGPLVAYHFHRFTVVGPLANVPIGVLTNVLLIGGLGASFLSWLPGFLIGPVWWFLGGGVELLRWLALAFASLPFTAFSVQPPPVALLVVYYTLIGGLGVVLRRYALRKTLFAPAPAVAPADPGLSPRPA